MAVQGAGTKAGVVFCSGTRKAGGSEETGRVLAQTRTYTLHRNRNAALRKACEPKANSSLTPYFEVKRRVAERAAAFEGAERCAECDGIGRSECAHCGGVGRANYTSDAILPTGTNPVWCTTCGGSGLSYCVQCRGTGEAIFKDGIGFRLPVIQKAED